MTVPLEKNNNVLVKTLRRIIVLMLLLPPFLSCIGGCTKKEPEFEERIVLTWWSPKRGEARVKTMANLPVYRRLQERTGITVDFIHPPPGQHAEQFQAMVVAGTLPDIISHDFVNDYPGGIEKAIRDGIIVPVNELLETSAPNLSRYLEEHPETAELLRTGEGTLFCFPSLQTGPEIRTYMGPFYRADLFAVLGIDPPETMDQWEDALAILRESPLVDIPLHFYGGNIRQTHAFIGAFGAGWGFYQDNGTVRYGPMEPGFSLFIRTFADWYKKGYIDPGFAVNSRRVYQRQAERKAVGIFIDYVSSIELYTGTLARNHPGCSLRPLPYPSLAEDSVAEFGHLSPEFVPFASAYITASNSRPKETARFLDYAYSEEGTLLFNFGIEGESYDMTAEGPVFRKTIGGADGFTAGLKGYITAGPYIKDPRQFHQSLVLEEQREAVHLWAATNAAGHQLPPLYPPPELSGEVDGIMRRIRPYEDDAVIRLITEGASEADIAGFQQTLREMGIERAVEIMQQCLEEKTR